MAVSASALSECSAVVVGYQGDSGRLLELARRVGFGSIQEIDDDPTARKPDLPVVFFLVNHRLSQQSKGVVIRRLRRSPSLKVRCAPIIAIGADVAFNVVLHHIAMGCDDFISLPERQAIVKNRLLNQLDRVQTYIETATYFGPDRRRLEAPDHVNKQRQAYPHSHTRLEIRRTTARGVEIVRKEIFA